MAIHTDWVSPAQEITGRDHLGVQAVSEHLYATLLPGITNVTDRARCYAFYPWFVWKFDREAKNKGVDEFIRMFRRAEYQRMVDRFGDWEDDYSIVSGEEQLSNPCFIVVDKNGRKRKEVLTEPPPSWELAQKKDEATASNILRDTLSDSELKSRHATEPEEVQSP